MKHRSRTATGLNMVHLQLAGRAIAAALLSVALIAVSVITPAGAQPPAGGGQRPRVGVQINNPAAFEGYTLVFPLQSTSTYLIDMQGRVVRAWESRYLAGQEAYLLENGNLLRAGKVADNEAIFAGAGAGGRVQEFSWD